MIFEKNTLYHIYNQGNNKKRIFLNQDNYQLFMYKIRCYVLPYSDILAWCLMPNHFHLMVLVNETELELEKQYNVNLTSKMNSNNEISKQKKRTFNDSIGILLRSYTRRINAENQSTGSLFRQASKANSINSFGRLHPNFWKTRISLFNMIPEKQYPQVCFNYIHNNPVKAGLAKRETDWEYSSAREYANLTKEDLVNKQQARKYVDF